MRKIEQNLLAAISANKAFACGNTTFTPVKYDSNGNFEQCGYVYLHGHEIASFNANGTGRVNIDTLRRWPTVTTKSRLRALGFNVYTKAHKTYLDGIAIDT